jgi:hypothetical protein
MKCRCGKEFCYACGGVYKACACMGRGGAQNLFMIAAPQGVPSLFQGLPAPQQVGFPMPPLQPQQPLMRHPIYMPDQQMSDPSSGSQGFRGRGRHYQHPQSGIFGGHPSGMSGAPNDNNGFFVPRYSGRGGMYEGIEFGNKGGYGSQRGMFRGMDRPPSSNNGMMPSQRGRGGMYEGVDFGNRGGRGGHRGGGNHRGSGFRGGI